jgi:hypothetical protein
MAKRAMTAASLTMCLLLFCQSGSAADSFRTTESIDAPDFTQDSLTGEPGAPGRGSTWEQRRFNEEQREQESPQLRIPGEDERRPGGITREREQPRLQAPPPSVQPRRNGTDELQRGRRQIGPRRFAPTPDFNGRGSPFSFDRSPEARPDQKR